MDFKTIIEKTPQFDSLKTNYERNAWHDETTYEHTMNVVGEYKKYLKIRKPPFTEYKIGKYTNTELIELVILLHDIAKPITLVLNSKNETIFPDHEVKGVLLAKKILMQLGSNKYVIKFVTEMIKFHGEPNYILDERQNYLVKFSKLRKLIPETFKETIFLGMLDTMGSKLKKFNKEEYNFRMKKYNELLAE